MANRQQAVKMTDTVYWVGAIDWNSRDFHGYLTPRGTTYNAFLVMADKITLIDTVKAPFRAEMLERISSVVNPSDIAYLVSNHAEPDHSGSLPETIGAIRPEKVFASPMGVKTLRAYYGNLDLTAVKTGDTVSMGNREISFLETRMLHWPDSMFSYLPDEKVLFSSDAFGMHLASSQRFADQIDPSILEYEGAKYFANIILPYAALVTKLLAQVRADGLELAMILPDHGPAWRRGSDIAGVLERYGTWAAQPPRRKALIVYDTMWGSTDRMAQAIAEGIWSRGVEVSVKCMKANHRSDIAHELLGCGALLAGSPTINNSLFPSMADVMCYLEGLRPKNLIGSVFGSFGWSGEAIPVLEKTLDTMGVTRIGQTVTQQYLPGQDTLDRCYTQGITIAEELLKAT